MDIDQFDRDGDISIQEEMKLMAAYRFDATLKIFINSILALENIIR